MSNDGISGNDFAKFHPELIIPDDTSVEDYMDNGFFAIPDNILDGTERFMLLGFQLNDIGMPVEIKHPLRMLRRRLLAGHPDGEIGEYLDAELANDPAEVLDGLLDVIVIAWGTALKYFGPEVAKAAAAEVVRSNLSKVDGSLGPIVYDGDDPDEKILKPKGWTPPDIKGVLQQAMFTFDEFEPGTEKRVEIQDGDDTIAVYKEETQDADWDAPANIEAEDWNAGRYDA